jgi:putative methionine-R-sulfoxide reductase with GAF domain
MGPRTEQAADQAPTDLLNRVLWLAAAAGLLTGLYGGATGGFQLPLLGVGLGLMLVAAVLQMVMRAFGYRPAAILLLSVLFVGAIAWAYDWGSHGRVNAMMFLVVILLAVPLPGWREALIALAASIAAVLLLAAAESADALPDTETPSIWLQAVLFSVLASLMVTLVYQHGAVIRRRLREAQAEILALGEQQYAMNNQVDRRGRALQASVEVSRRLSTIRDPGELIRSVVEELRSVFSFSHTHVYLLDESGDTLHLVGGTGEIGQQLMMMGHALQLGQGLVGKAAAQKEVVWIPDVADDPTWLPNPLLPAARAEAAIPIAVDSRLIGVLDVQQDQAGGLDFFDVELLLSIAGQLAIALQNADFYGHAQVQVARRHSLYEVEDRLQSAESVDEVLQVAARALAQNLELPSASILLAGASEALPQTSPDARAGWEHGRSI